MGDLKVLPFISAFKSMDKVVRCCFSTRKVGNDIEKYIDELSIVFKGTEISESLKIHVV